MASASKDRTVKFWDMETGENTNTLNLYNNKLHGLAGLDDGNVAVAVDNQIRIYNPKTMELAKSL